MLHVLNMPGGQETSCSVISAGVYLFPCGCNTYSCQVGAGWYLCWNIWILATLQWILPCGTWVPEAITSVGACFGPPGIENGETVLCHCISITSQYPAEICCCAIVLHFAVWAHQVAKDCIFAAMSALVVASRDHRQPAQWYFSIT